MLLLGQIFYSSLMLEYLLLLLSRYEGYLDVLLALAPRVPVGGFMVMDDYHCVDG